MIKDFTKPRIADIASHFLYMGDCYAGARSMSYSPSIEVLTGKPGRRFTDERNATQR